MDIATSKTGSSHREFNHMLDDRQSNKLDIILTKNISRFGRDTVEILDVLNQLKVLGVRVFFEQEELEKQIILSPTGNGKWCKRTINLMLCNEKYTGDAKLSKSEKSGIYYLASDNNLR